MLCKIKSCSRLKQTLQSPPQLSDLEEPLSQFNKQGKIFVEIYQFGLAFVTIVSSTSELKERERTSFELQKFWKETVSGGITVL